MSKKRRQHTSSFKHKVVLEAIKGNLTLSELSAKYSLTSSVISRVQGHLMSLSL